MSHKTGVEMEALAGASAAALCVYDSARRSPHDIVIEELRLEAKSGGKRLFDRRAQAAEALRRRVFLSFGDAAARSRRRGSAGCSACRVYRSRTSQMSTA